MPDYNLMETPRLVLRFYTPKDGDAVWKVVSHPDVYGTTYAIPKDYPRTRVDWWFQFMNNTRKNKTGFEYGMFHKATGAYIGNCGIVNVQKQSRCGTISYFINPDFWKQGYATEGGEALLSFCFCSLGLHRVSGRCFSSNLSSRRVMEKLGFQYEGTGRDELYKDGTFIDVDHFSILQNDFFQNKE